MLKKRIALFALCLAVSGLLFLNAWQGYRYHTLSDRVAALEKEQKDLLEKNRAAIAEIAHEQSLRRIEEKAGAALEPLDPSHITRVTVGEGGR
jgi:ABC-type phosphate transport system auxiliary subunit